MEKQVVIRVNYKSFKEILKVFPKTYKNESMASYFERLSRELNKFKSLV